MEGLQVFIFVLILLICVFLALIVLIQNPKGGGLDSSFQSANQIGGVKRTADFLEKGTWTLAIGLFVLCLVAAAVQERGSGVQMNAPQYQETMPEQQQPAPGQGAAEMPQGQGQIPADSSK